MAQCGSYEPIREGDEYILRIDCESCSFFPSLEDNPDAMELAMRALIKEGQGTRVVFVQKRDYEYDFEQTRMLLDVARAFRVLDRERQSVQSAVSPACQRFAQARLSVLQNIVTRLLLRDPLAAYVQLVRIHEDENKLLKAGAVPSDALACLKGYYDYLRDAVSILRKTSLVEKAEPFLAGFVVGDRSVYRRLFLPAIRPDFMLAKLMAAYPVGADEIDNYEITVPETGERTGIEVTLFRLPGSVQVLYHVVPPEFRLDDDIYDLLDTAKKQFEVHQPTRSEFLDPQRLRQTFTNLGSDLLSSIAQERGISLSQKQLNDLTAILLRYSIGFGLIEVLLQDSNVQDVVINSPVGKTPVFVVHNTADECVTNIIPTVPESNSWASKLRLISGRPLDEANPILDTELVVPYARSRVAAIYPPLNPTGLAFALRRHRDDPWTLPLFMKGGYMNAMAAGLISFLVDGNRTLLVAGTRSAGKTSLLGAIMVEIMRKRRIITIEDSVTADCRIVVEREGMLQRVTVGHLIDGLIEQGAVEHVQGRDVVRCKNLKVYAMDKEGKVVLAPATQCIRHKVTKQLYEVMTATGRRIRVTCDHSLFTLGSEGILTPVRTGDLQVGDCLVTPRVLPNSQLQSNHIRVLDYSVLPGVFICGDSLRAFVSDHWNDIRTIAKGMGYSKSVCSHWRKSGMLPWCVLSKLGIRPDDTKLFVKKRTSSTRVPAVIAWNPELLTLVGLWLADGSYDRNSIIISVVDPAERNIVKMVAEQLGLSVHKHSDEVSLMINSGVLKDIFVHVLGLTGNAYTKTVPNWVFNLSKDQVACVLRGLFSGDGCVGDKEFSISLASEQLLNDVQTLCLQFGIIMRTTDHMRCDNTFNGRISAVNMLRQLSDHIGLLQEYKVKRLGELCARHSTHDSTDIVPFGGMMKQEAVKTIGLNHFDYISRNYAIGRGKFSHALDEISQPLALYRALADSDVFWDRVVKIEKIECIDAKVYDFSVPGFENFVCENILAHNTLELPVEALRNMNYNIQSMKVASALTRGTSEVTADEGIRTTLRLGDSALIVGEVRSTEARALYESMRVGALANVVAGTIHGDSPYGVYDRVVNDLNVPKTSFKATDIVIVANRVRSADGLRSLRKLTQITEVRKTWEEDPVAEGGFVDLLRYDGRKEMADITTDLLNGDSEVLKSIAGTIREFAGNWDAVWENIQLRAQMKQAVVDLANKTKFNGFLEARFVIDANDEFHMASERVREEVGGLQSSRIFKEWSDWLKEAARKVLEKRGA